MARRGVCKDENFYFEWRLRHKYCQVCGVNRSQALFRDCAPLSCHHVVKPGRSHEATNLLMLCNTCHTLAELQAVRRGGILLPKLPLAVCLTVKRLREPHEFDPARLAELFGRNLPDPEPIPAVFEADFRRRRPGDRSLFQA